MNRKKIISKYLKAYKRIMSELEGCRKNTNYQKKKQRILSCNRKFELSLPDDLNHASAWSYGHWKFFMKMCGVWVYNDYRYSHTTSGHQSTLRFLIKAWDNNDALVSLNFGSGSLSQLSPKELVVRLLASAFESENDALYERKPYGGRFKQLIEQAYVVCHINKLDFDSLYNECELIGTERLFESVYNRLERQESMKASRLEAKKNIESLEAVSL